MSSITKFRAWNTDTKTMVYNDVDNNVFVIYHDKKWALGSPDYDWGIYGGAHQSNYHLLMQSSGLTDKNGKDIYDSDIVSCHNHGAISSTDIVSFENGCFWLKKSGNLLYLHCKPWDISKCEVIGNIYENPELLR